MLFIILSLLYQKQILTANENLEKKKYESGRSSLGQLECGLLRRHSMVNYIGTLSYEKFLLKVGFACDKCWWKTQENNNFSPWIKHRYTTFRSKQNNGSKHWLETDRSAPRKSEVGCICWDGFKTCFFVISLILSLLK